MNQDDTFAALEKAIGGVCLTWSLIESHVGILLEEEVWAALHGQLTDNTSTIFKVFNQNMEVRQKIQTAKAIAVGFREPKFERVERLLNKIDNELRNERNRYIHDSWISEGDGFIRVKPGSFITRQQARKPIAKLGKHHPFASIDDVNAFQIELSHALRELLALITEFEALTEQRRTAKSDRQAHEE